jgi:hypothetical protein
MKEVVPETFTNSTWLLQSIYRMKKYVPGTSPTACSWLVHSVYLMSKNGPETSPTACTAYIYDERSWSRDFPYRVNMA